MFCIMKTIRRRSHFLLQEVFAAIPDIFFGFTGSSMRILMRLVLFQRKTVLYAVRYTICNLHFSDYVCLRAIIWHAVTEIDRPFAVKKFHTYYSRFPVDKRRIYGIIPLVLRRVSPQMLD